MPENNDQKVLSLANQVADSFSETDWVELGQRIGFRERINTHARLLRSLRFNDPDYRGHVIDMVATMVKADAANFAIIEAMTAGDNTAFFATPARYITGERLGFGGYGEVYREKDTLLDLDFARKELSPSPQVTDEVIGRFLREARILFRLSHPYIITVRDVGRVGRMAYIRMDFFEGKPLNTLGQVPPARALKIITKVAAGMAYAHGCSVIHRDLKPSNVLVLGEDVRIIDFGLGAFIDADLDTNLTRSDQTIAGGSYAAPEVKERSKHRDGRCDVFSIGGLWFNLLTSRDPSGAAPDTRLRAVGDIPQAHQDLLMECLSADAEKRPRSQELWIRLKELSNEAGSANVAAPAPPTNELSENETRLMAAFAALYPTWGDTVHCKELSRQASTVKLQDDVKCGLAVTSLEIKGYISSGRFDDGDLFWSVTPTGKNWIASNADSVVRMRESDQLSEVNW